MIKTGPGQGEFDGESDGGGQREFDGESDGGGQEELDGESDGGGQGELDEGIREKAVGPGNHREKSCGWGAEGGGCEV